jgi:hypothetical protein
VSVSVTYLLNGQAVQNPVNAGVYEVLAVVTDPAFEGSGGGTLTISKANQAITFAAIHDKTMGDAAFSLSGTSNVALPVTFAVAPGDTEVVLNGSQVTITAAGKVTVIASQAGNLNYNAASAERSFCIKPLKPTITASFANASAPVLTSSNAAGNQWYLNESPINESTNVTALVSQAGTYKVQTTIEGCSGDFSEGYSLIITALEPEAAGESIQAYPNPAHDYIDVKGVSTSATATLQDVAGARQQAASSAHNRALRLDVRALSSGVYFLYLKDSNTTKVIRFQKQ